MAKSTRLEPVSSPGEGPDSQENLPIYPENPPDSPKTPEVSPEDDMFLWCQQIGGRIVFGQTRTGVKFCRVTVARNVAAECPTFVEAAGKCRATLERIRDARGTYMRHLI